MALDVETEQLLKGLASSGTKPISEMTVEEARGLTGQLADLYGSGPEMAKVQDGRIPASGGFVPYRLLTPTADPKGVIIYYHGGGWVIGQSAGLRHPRSHPGRPDRLCGHARRLPDGTGVPVSNGGGRFLGRPALGGRSRR